MFTFHFFASFLATVLTWAAARRPAAQSLHDLDARTLADIGVDPSELESIDAEANGLSALTRRRIVAA